MDAEWRVKIEKALHINTSATLAIGQKLDDHVKAYDTLAAKVQPAIDAIDTMQQGIRVIGWIGMATKKVALWMAAIGTAAGVVWAWLHGYPPPK